MRWCLALLQGTHRKMRTHGGCPSHGSCVFPKPRSHFHHTVPDSNFLPGLSSLQISFHFIWNTYRQSLLIDRLWFRCKLKYLTSPCMYFKTGRPNLSEDTYDYSLSPSSHLILKICERINSLSVAKEITNLGLLILTTVLKQL